MDTTLFNIIDCLLENNCRYLQVYIEEYGESAGKSLCFYSVLLRSLDTGLSTNIISEIQQDLDDLNSELFEAITYIPQENIQIYYKNRVFHSIFDNSGYGTSMSFDFINSYDLPQILHNKILDLIENGFDVEYSLNSKFRKLAEYALSSLHIPQNDYKSCIIDSILSVTSVSSPLINLISKEFAMDLNSLHQTLFDLLLK